MSGAAGAGRQEGGVKRAFEVMGTVVSFRVLGLGEEAARTALEQACDVLREADETFSLWKPDSPVSAVPRRHGTGPDPAGGRGRTGAVPDGTELVPGLVRPLGHARRSRPHRAGQRVGRGTGASVLRRAGATAAMVSGGGDLAVFGCPAPGREWRVGIQHPWRRDALAGIIEVRAAAATSGTYGGARTS